MRALVLSDLHIAKSTPWSTDWEDCQYLYRRLHHIVTGNEYKFPDFIIICGDTFNSPRILQGDVYWFNKLIGQLSGDDTTPLWINGNHDPGAYHVCGGVDLTQKPYFGIYGHHYSQDLDSVRVWLNSTDCLITVTHQSASMFMDLGISGLDQLHPEDFHAPLNIIGDTHVTRVYTSNNITCLSPGILMPMRSRKELFEAQPKLIVLDDGLEPEDAGDCLLDLDRTTISAYDIPVRPHLMIESQEQLEKYIADNWKNEVPVIGYVTPEVRKTLDISHYGPSVIRLIEYSDTLEISDVSLSSEVVPEDTVDVVSTAASLMPDDAHNKQELLTLVGDLLSTNAPEEIAENYLKGTKE